MAKKRKVVTCMDCGDMVGLSKGFDEEVYCLNDKFGNGKSVGLTPYEIKANNFIPEWCPLDDWEE